MIPRDQNQCDSLNKDYMSCAKLLLMARFPFGNHLFPQATGKDACLG